MPRTLATLALSTAAVGLAAGGWMYAASWPTSQLFGSTLVAGPDPDEIALTFDDGPNPLSTPALLEVLARHDVRATFFCIGAFARQQAALVREVASAGHLIGNHTVTHPHLAVHSAARIRRELADADAILEDILGEPVRYVRPPFGWRRPAVLRMARELGLTPVMWNVTAYDWEPIGDAGILANLQRGIARNRRLGRASNLLLHDGSHRAQGASRADTVRAVDFLLTAHTASQSRFVTVDLWDKPAANSST